MSPNLDFCPLAHMYGHILTQNHTHAKIHPSSHRRFWSPLPSPIQPSKHGTIGRESTQQETQTYTQRHNVLQDHSHSHLLSLHGHCMARMYTVSHNLYDTHSPTYT